MQGNIAQIVALATHGNLALRAPGQEPVRAFHPSNSTFQFCERVRFVDWLPQADGERAELPYAEDPSTWFARLAREEVSSIRLRYIAEPADAKLPERISVSFAGGGGRWLLECLGPSGSDYWEARWEVGDQSRTDQRIWRVTYARLTVGEKPSRLEAVDLGSLHLRMRATLTDIGEFARKQDLAAFAEHFEDARARLDSDSPFVGVYHTDITPSGLLSLPASQLLGGVQAGWVFGGMGSWNDLCFEGADQARYERLGNELYSVLVEATLAAVNSAAAPQRPVRPWWRIWSSR